MNRVFVHGVGAVSPAGWGVAVLTEALGKGEPLATQSLPRPGWDRPIQVRPVPAAAARPAFLGHPRLRRAGAMAQHTVAAALEALGDDAVRVQSGAIRLGVIVGMMAGGVTYSRRFYEEVLRDPATASPLIFPETVFNAPASHLSAYLGSPTINYTLVGDHGTFLQGLALAARWLDTGRADACLVVGAEETDWIVADAVRLFQKNTIYSGGAGAVYLKCDADAPVELEAVTDAFTFTQKRGRAEAARKMRAQLPALAANELLCDNDGGLINYGGGKSLTPKTVLGEAFVASAAWQCVAACEWLRRPDVAAANVTVVGANQQAIGARFVRNHL